MWVNPEFEGEQELLRALKAIEDSVQAEMLADAGLSAMEPMRRAAQAKAPKGQTRKLSQDIQKEVAEKGHGRAAIDMGPHEDAFYGRFQEFGWRASGRAKKGEHGGKQVRPRPFMRPAFDTQKDNVVAWFAELLARSIDSII